MTVSAIPTERPVRSRDFVLVARDGHPLAATLFSPAAPVENTVERTVVVFGAVGVKRDFYRPFALHLAERGHRVLTCDYRGVGGSRPARLAGFEASLRAWGEEDAAGAIDWACSRYPKSRLLAIGHSAGGQLVGLAHNVARLSGLFTVASQSGYWGHWPAPRRYLMASLWYALLPALTAAFGYFPARALQLGEDLPAGVSFEWSRWCRNPSYAVDARGVPIAGHYDTFDGALLSLSFSDDAMAPRAAVDWLAGRYRAARVCRRHLAPGDLEMPAIGHFGFFRPAARAQLWRAASDWLASH